MVVPQGLDLIIIIKIRQLRDGLLGFLIQDRLKQFSGLAGASDDQPFPVLVQQAFRNPGPTGKIFQVGGRDQLVQVITADVIFHQDDNMVGGELADRILVGISKLVDAFQGGNVSVFEHLHELYKNLCRSSRVVHRPVMIFQGNVQRFCHHVQLIF